MIDKFDLMDDYGRRFWFCEIEEETETSRARRLGSPRQLYI
jgi:hypothetical protein